MKKVFNTLGLIAIFAVISFTSCNRNDEPNNNPATFTIRANYVIGSEYSNIALVEAVVENDRWRTFVVGEAPFQNNGFNLSLTTDIPTSFLQSVTNGLENESNITISDRNANIARFFRLEAYDENGRFVGDLLNFAGTNSGFYDKAWFFADRPVTISGSTRRDSWQVYFDLNLRRGWNVVFIHKGENQNGWIDTFSSQRPNNVDFVWSFVSWNNWSSEDLTTTRTEKRSGNSIFTRR